jgi:gliding motility-associated-like protein
VNTVVTVNPTPRAIPINVQPSICFDGNSEVILTSPTVMTSGAIRFNYTVSVTGGPGIVIGNVAPENDRIPNYKITFPYQNYSDTLQSVYYSITPKVDNAVCVPGNIFVSEVKVHPLPLQNLLLPKTLTCDGGSDATLRVVLSKGTTPFNVLWNGPFDYYRYYSTSKDTTDKKNLKGGIYTVTVTDNLGCTNNDNQFISGARLDSYFQPYPKVTGYGTTCPESTDGELWIRENSGSTGIAPFTYKILYNNVDTVITNTLTTTNVFQKYFNLPSGNYKVFIKDVNGCINTDYPEANIVAPDAITVEFSKKGYLGGYNISCKGYNDGSVWIDTISGGNGGYRYKWSTVNGTISGVDTLDRLDNITAGKYYLRTTDMLGCMKVDSVTLTEPDGMQLAGSVLSRSPDNNTNISCYGGNNGSIEMTISGGSGVYTYSWSSSNGFVATSKDISLLKAGVYTCIVTDLNGCILTPSPSFTLTEPAALAIASTASTSNDGSYNINCNGGTGSILITITGGSVGTYTYTWSTTDGSGIIAGQKDQLALTVGTYHLIVKDANNCETTKDITLTQPPVFGLQLSATNITCQSPGFNNGSVNLTVSGGAGPYNYNWSNGSINEDISGLTQGYYKVVVTYNNTCMKSDSVRINLPPPLTYTKSLSDYNLYNVSCNGMANGSIDINPTNGLAPFIYTWTGPNGFTATTEDISDLKAGQYRLLITDNNYCTATETINLTEPGSLGMTINLSASAAGGFNINCAGDSTGSIGIEPLNQVKTVEYLWSDGLFGKTRTNLPAGSYTVIITDANNCHAGSTIILTEPDSMKLVFDITKPLCPDKPDGEIRLIVTGGVQGTDYSYKWSDNSTGRDLSNIPKGYYKVTVKDMNGCSLKDSVTVEPSNETCLVIPNAISPNGDLINDVWNIGMIELYPEMEIRVFNRWGETVWRSDKGYPRPWDGKSNGLALPIDSYHYIIDLHNGTKPLLGNVTIVR